MSDLRKESLDGVVSRRRKCFFPVLLGKALPFFYEIGVPWRNREDNGFCFMLRRVK